VVAQLLVPLQFQLNVAAPASDPASIIPKAAANGVSLNSS
jgi:hypothetical protein